MIKRYGFTPAIIIACSSSDLHLKMEIPGMGTRQTLNESTSSSHLTAYTEPDLLLLIWSVVFCLLGQPLSQGNNESTAKYQKGRSLTHTEGDTEDSFKYKVL